MDEIIQRFEKEWSEMDQDLREVVSETLFMLLIKHARSLWLKNQELEAKLAKAAAELTALKET